MSSYYKTKETVLRQIAKGANFNNKAFDVFRHDKDAVLAALKRVSEHSSKRTQVNLEDYLTQEFWHDIDFVRLAYKRSPQNIEMASEEILSNKELVMELLHDRPEIYFECSLRDDSDVAALFVQLYAHLVRFHLPRQLRYNMQWMSERIKTTPRVYDQAPYFIRMNPELAMRAMDGADYKKVPVPQELIEADVDVAVLAITRDSGIYHLLSDSRKADIAITNAWLDSSTNLGFWMVLDSLASEYQKILKDNVDSLRGSGDQNQKAKLIIAAHLLSEKFSNSLPEKDDNKPRMKI